MSSCRFCYIEFENPESALAAKHDLNSNLDILVCLERKVNQESLENPEKRKSRSEKKKRRIAKQEEKRLKKIEKAKKKKEIMDADPENPVYLAKREEIRLKRREVRKKKAEIINADPKNPVHLAKKRENRLKRREKAKKKRAIMKAENNSEDPPQKKSKLNPVKESVAYPSKKKSLAPKVCSSYSEMESVEELPAVDPNWNVCDQIR